MVASAARQEASPMGHIAIYAMNDRRRNAICRAVRAAGHSCRDAAGPALARDMLASQRYDVGIWVVRDEAEAESLGAALEGMKLPLHTLVVGSASALPHIRRRRGGTLRFVQTTATAAEIAKVAGASIAKGTWDEEAVHENANHHEPVELEGIIEAAASAVYERAKRKRQRFNTVVSAEDGNVLGSRSALRKIFTSLLGVVVDLAPAGAFINTRATEGDDEWHISVAAETAGPSRRPIAATAGDLTDEEHALQSVARDIKGQGGILWVDLAGPEALSVSFTLPMPAEVMRHA